METQVHLSAPSRPDPSAASGRGLLQRPSVRWTLLLAAVAGAWYLAGYLWPRALNYLGLAVYDGIFLDLSALLAAGEAHVAGMIVYFPNPFDVFRRPHCYSSWWLVMGDLGLKRGDVVWLGPCLVLAFGVVAVLTLRPRNRREFWLGLALLCSPPVQLGVIRTNNDLVVFLVLAALVPCLMSRLDVARLCGPFLVAFATGLKYYPAVASLLLLREPSRRALLWRAPLLLALGALVLLSVYEDTLYFRRTLPAPFGFFSFGYVGLWTKLEMSGMAAVARVVALGAIVVAGWWLARRNDAGPASLAEVTGLKFTLGAVLLAACFWVGMNWGYRWVFATWLLPWLWREKASGESDGWAGGRRASLWLLLGCLWADGLCALAWNLGLGRALPCDIDTYTAACWLLFQPMHWVLFVLLSVACAVFAVREIASWRTNAAAAS